VEHLGLTQEMMMVSLPALGQVQVLERMQVQALERRKRS
jgi:hypothetical protein